jgi:hypothetical protein
MTDNDRTLNFPGFPPIAAIGPDITEMTDSAKLPKLVAQVTKPMPHHVVTIWHNVQMESGHPMGFFGYKSGHAMAPVFVYTTQDAINAAEDAFKMFNAPEDYLSGGELAIAKQYRANQLRSLSVGDIVQVDDTFYVCESFGFGKLGTNVPLNIQPDPWSRWGKPDMLP